jgi:hypothetical protein
VIVFVPLLDEQGRLVSLVRNRTGKMQMVHYLSNRAVPGRTVIMSRSMENSEMNY